MKYNFDNQFIIYYEKNRLTNVYKRVINKTDNDKYNIITYYKEKGENVVFKSRIYFNEVQIEKLIDDYINEFNIKKKIEFYLNNNKKVFYLNGNCE